MFLTSNGVNVVPPPRGKSTSTGARLEAARAGFFSASVVLDLRRSLCLSSSFIFFGFGDTAALSSTRFFDEVDMREQSRSKNSVRRISDRVTFTLLRNHQIRNGSVSSPSHSSVAYYANQQIIRYHSWLPDETHINLNSQNRVGSKFGGGGVAGASETNVDRRERLRKLALETIDLAKVRELVIDPVFSLTVFLGSLYSSKPSWVVRVSSMSHSTHERRLVPCSHAR
jgi:hypothetical protein